MRLAGRLGARGRSTSPGKSTARRGGIHLKVELVKNIKTIVLVVNNNVEPDPFKEYSQEGGIRLSLEDLRCFRYALRKKLRDYLGIFPKWRTPPPIPPFWEPLIQNKKYRLFCILDP